MRRYMESLSALNDALNLMIEEGDTLLAAAITHPMHLVEKEMLRQRVEIIRAQYPANAPHPADVLHPR